MAVIGFLCPSGRGPQFVPVESSSYREFENLQFGAYFEPDKVLLGLNLFCLGR